jgi:hypothetical protein
LHWKLGKIPVSESESDLLYGWRPTANHFILATSHLRPTTTIFIFQLNTCDYSPYVTPALTRGYVCRLQLLLVLASAVILGSESRGTRDYILLSQIRDSPYLESQQVPVFISPRNRVARLYPPGTGFPFLRLLRLAGLRWRYSTPPRNGSNFCELLHYTVKPVLKGISRVQNIFLLKPGFRLIKVYTDSQGT